jgi:histidinol dehydrogenase
VKILRTGEKGFEQYLLERERGEEQDDARLQRKVTSILKDVRARGDEALLRYSALFDRVTLSARQLRVEQGEIQEAYRKVPRKFVATLEKAARRIRKFHELQKKGMKLSFHRKEKGIQLGQRVVPLERVGIYVPGGKASYPSTVLMAAIPARVAGVEEILMVTPPQQEGISPAVLVAADLAGVNQIYQIGGAQAIAALAYGTGSVPKVDKIVGPGNRYVALAKRMVYGVVDVDMVAGPSEIVIVSDENTPPSFVAADLISQAEHDERALAVLVTPSEELVRRVRIELKKQLSSLGRRRIAEASLTRRGAILIVRDLGEAMVVANRIAPEHLELAVSHPLTWVKKVKHAGAVFLGPFTPEAIGDYLAGPNHILPTAGTARHSSSLGVEDFMKRTNIMGFARTALMRFAEDVKRFTEWEGLEGHYRAVQKRMDRR